MKQNFLTEPDKHANTTNPCIGICSNDDKGRCIGCFRSDEERMLWYSETTEWRENVLLELKKREDLAFGDE